VSVVVIALYLLDLDWVAALRDASLSEKWESGLISNFGIAVMTVGAMASATGWLFTRSPALLWLALFCIAFSIDDSLMLHEGLSRLEFLAYLAYGILLVLIWRELAALHGQLVLWPLALVGLAFVTSAAVDQFGGVFEYLVPDSAHGRLHAVLFGLEDVPKTIGVLCLALVAVNESLDALEAHRAARKRA
jgi:hypothetical protein